MNNNRVRAYSAVFLSAWNSLLTGIALLAAASVLAADDEATSAQLGPIIIRATRIQDE